MVKDEMPILYPKESDVTTNQFGFRWICQYFVDCCGNIFAITCKKSNRDISLRAQRRKIFSYDMTIDTSYYEYRIKIFGTYIFYTSLHEKISYY